MFERVTQHHSLTHILTHKHHKKITKKKNMRFKQGRNGEIQTSQSISITCFHIHQLIRSELSHIQTFSSQQDYMIPELRIGSPRNGLVNFVHTKRVKTLSLFANLISRQVTSLPVIAIAGFVKNVTINRLSSIDSD